MSGWLSCSRWSPPCCYHCGGHLGAKLVEYFLWRQRPSIGQFSLQSESHLHCHQESKGSLRYWLVWRWGRGESQRGRDSAYWASLFIVFSTSSLASLQSILHTCTIDFPKHKSDCLIPLLKTLHCFLLSWTSSPYFLTWCARLFTVCLLLWSIAPLPPFCPTFDASYDITVGLPCNGWLSWQKKFACNVGDLGLIPGLGRSPGRERLPTPVFWPGEFHGLYSTRGCKEWHYCIIWSGLQIFLLQLPYYTLYRQKAVFCSCPWHHFYILY